MIKKSLNSVPYAVNSHIGRRVIVAMLILSMALFSACDDDELKDDARPSITIVSPGADDLLKGTVTIEIEVEDQSVASATVILDDAVIYESSDPTFETTFDTRQVSDGTHVLKVVAVDQAGNEAEVTMSVEVLNTLLKFTVPPGLMSSRDHWAFVTTAAGELLGVKEIPDNGQVVFETPSSFEKGQRIVLHSFSYYEIAAANYQLFNISSYTDVKPGEYKLKTPIATSSSTGGNCIININNVPDTYDWPNPVAYISSVGTTLTPTGYSVSMAMVENNLDILMVLQGIERETIPKYRMFENVTTGSNQTVEFNTFASMSGVTIPLGMQVDDVSGEVFVRVHPSLLSWVDYSSLVDASSIRLYYPNNAYPSYFTRLSAVEGNRLYTYNKNGALPTTLKTIDANVSALSHSNSALSLTTSGTFDLMYVHSVESWVYNAKMYTTSWYYNMDDASSHQFTIPQIPAEIVSRYPALFEQVVKFDDVYAIDYDSFEDYDAYIHHLLQTEEITVNEYSEAISTTFSFENGNGRKKNRRVEKAGTLEIDNPAVSGARVE